MESGCSEGTSIRQALETLGVAGRIVHSSSSAEALAYLNDAHTPQPAVVVADASDSQAGGLEVLRQVKADPQLKTIPVIIVAPSSDVRIIDESFGLGVAGYVVKSSDPAEFVEAVRAVHEYWMLSELPAGR